MRVLLFLYCIMVFVGSAVAQTHKMKNDLQRRQLKGHVKSYTESFCLKPDTMWHKVTYISYYQYNFDRHGFITSDNATSRGNVFDQTIYCDFNNHTIRDVIELSIMTNYQRKLTSRIFWNKQGLIDSYFNYHNDPVASEKITYKYIKAGYKFYNSSGKDTSNDKYFNIVNRRHTTCTKEYNAIGKLLSITNIIYDKKGNPVSNTLDNFDINTSHRKIIIHYEYKGYDKANNWLLCIEKRNYGAYMAVYLRQRQYTYY